MPFIRGTSSPKGWSRAVFSLDVRSLALFRVGLGLMVLADHVMRAFGMRWFYTDEGVYPTRAIWRWVATFRKPCVHALSGEIELQLFLFGLAGVAAVGLILGWRTRLMAVTCWFLTISVQHRFVQINSGADALLAGLLFWGMFLPLGARFSMDARRRPPGRPVHHLAYSVATAAMVGQLLLLYVFNVVNKHGASWWDGSSVIRALHIDQYATPFGAWVRDSVPWITYPLARLTLVVEGAVILLLVPWRRTHIRLGLVASFWALHLGFAVCMYVALFSPISMVAWLAVIPSGAWRLPVVRRRIAPEEPGGETPHRLPRFVAAFVLVVFFALPAWANFDYTWGWKRPARVTQAARFLRLNQIWRMFAPAPLKGDFWWIVEAKTTDGRVLDLMREGQERTWKKPTYASQMYLTGKHRRLWMSLKCKKKPLRCKRILDRMCRDHNAQLAPDDPGRVVNTTLWKMKERTPQDLRKRPKVKPHKEFRRRCPSARALLKSKRSKRSKRSRRSKRPKDSKRLDPSGGPGPHPAPRP